jgi:hypothetical protein
MKRLCIATLLAVSAILVIPPSAHAFGIMGCWWNIDNTDADGWGGGIRQEIPLIPWGHEDDDDGDDYGAAYGDSVVAREHDDDDDDLKAEDSLVRLSLDTRASYLRFDDADLNMFPLEVGAMLGLGVLYGEIGGGYYIMDSGSEFEIENNWGWYMLAGVMLGKGTKGLFGEIKWTSLTSDFEDVDVDFEDVPDSLEADGIGVNVGISFGI